MKVFGIVFKEFFERYKEDNWGNFVNKFDGNIWILFDDKSSVWRLFRLDNDLIDVKEFVNHGEDFIERVQVLHAGAKLLL